jgi:hypothetical protein
MTSTMPLQNDTILVPSGQSNDYVVPLRGHSLLIKNKKIAKIAPQINVPVLPDRGDGLHGKVGIVRL